MADLKAALFSRLSTFAGLTALVGTTPTRVYPGTAPQNAATPFVTYQRISTDRPSRMGSDAGIVRARIQVTAWDEHFDDARAVAEQIRAALQRWRGTEAGVVIQDTFDDDEREDYDAQAKLHFVSHDFQVNHQE